MKKPIDPNLTNDQDDILRKISLGENEISKSDFVLENEEKSNFKEPNFHVTVDDIAQKSSSAKQLDASVNVDDILNELENGTLTENEHHNSSHHHHSGSHHHHHHSGSHHHSSSHRHHSSSHHHHHHHSSSHHSSKHKKKKLPVAARVIIAILLVLVIIFLAVFGTFYGLKISGEHDIKNNTAAQTDELYQDQVEYNGHTYQYNDDILTFAFIGVDQEDMKNVDETDFVGAADADVVIAVNSKTGKTSAIAVPRDTMVDVDIWSKSGEFIRTENTQLCLAYAYGDGSTQSCKSTVKAISRVLYSVPIDKYFALDLSGVAALNDAIGGVTLTSIYDLDAYNIKSGDTVTLKGKTAAAYVRTRDMDKVDASLNRVDRQVQYIKAYSQQALPAIVHDFSTVSNLYNTASKYSQTNISLNNATYIASLLLSKNIRDFDTYTISGTMTAEKDEKIKDIAHAQFYPDEKNLMETVLNVFYVQVD